MPTQGIGLFTVEGAGKGGPQGGFVVHLTCVDGIVTLVATHQQGMHSRRHWGDL